MRPALSDHAGHAKLFAMDQLWSPRRDRNPSSPEDYKGQRASEAHGASMSASGADSIPERMIARVSNRDVVFAPIPKSLDPEFRACANGPAQNTLAGCTADLQHYHPQADGMIRVAMLLD